MSVGQRIKEIIDSKKISVNDFAYSIGQTSQSIYNYVGNRTTPKVDIAESILKAFPDLNARWLLTGQGEMWESGDAMITQPDAEHQTRNNMINQTAIAGDTAQNFFASMSRPELEMMLSMAQSQLKDKEEIIELMRNEMQRLKARIEELEE